MEQNEPVPSSGERQCPKCGHRQLGGEECRNCGIIFRRLEEREERRKAAAEQAATPSYRNYDEEKNSGGLARFLMIALLVGVTAGVTYYFTAKKPAETLQTQAPPAVESSMADFDSPIPQPSQNISPQPVQTVGQIPPGTGGNRIEQARNATVDVLTPWGQGSGFFLLDTYIITNKHVVSADSKQVAEMQEKVRTARQMINLEEQDLQRLRNDLARMPDGPQRQQVIIILREREKVLAKVTAQVAEGEEQLRQLMKPLSAGDIKIRFFDGREQNIHSYRLSSKRDLAILLVAMPHDAVLQAATERDRLHQGDRVYTIGNPKGLGHTVTSGGFSGYRQWKETGEIFLQIDAPINSGNSGGPLIDAEGRVHGVNTMVLNNAQGIGFAIPIKAVFDDFGLQAP